LNIIIVLINGESQKVTSSLAERGKILMKLGVIC
jgi:hypothetical protein